MVTRPLNLRRITIVALAVAIMALTGIGIYHNAYRNSTTSAKAVVVEWTPNHAKYCSAVLGLPEIWQGAVHKPVTAVWELTYLEDSAVYSPTRQLHTQISAMAVAFANLIGDPSGLRVFARHPEWAPTGIVSTDPKVLAFLKSLAPYDTVKATPLTDASRKCVTFSPGTPNNVIDAVSSATTAYYLNVASGDTNAATIYQYEASVPRGVGEHVVAYGTDAKFIFDTGNAVCVTLPAPSDPPPTVVSCHDAGAGAG
jgi:hypothetical protein